MNAEDLLRAALERKAAGDLAGAAAACREAARTAPGWAMPFYLLGSTLKAQGDLDGALAAYRDAAGLQPDWAEARLNLGVVLQLRGQVEDALEEYSAAAGLRPAWHLPQHNLAEAWLKLGRPDRAVAPFRKSVELEPGFAESQVDLATTLLQLGEFEEGWRLFEWRWGLEGRTATLPGIDAPLWDGSPLEGRVILLWAEQGLGDTLQFVRFAGRVHDLGGRVWLYVPERLAGLLSTGPGVERVLFGDRLDLADVRAIDVQFPLMSLPRMFGTTLATIPAEVPYLSAPVARIPGKPGELKVGVVWASGPLYPGAARRDCAPADFAGLAELNGLRLYSLQFGERAAELGGGLPITDLGWHLGDFLRTAEVVQALDLVITVDTSMAHLSGALGRPTWVLLPCRADWRWLLDRDDSPWYPTLRLFRQAEAGDWSGVFERIRKALLRSSDGPLTVSDTV